MFGFALCSRGQWCQFRVDFLGRLPPSVDEVEVVFAEFVSCLHQEHRPFQGALDGIAAVRRLLPSWRSGTDPAKVYVRNWMRTRVVHRAPLLPVELVQTMAGAACILERVNLAGFLLVSFVALHCTVEVVGLKMSPNRYLHHVNTIILALPASKTAQRCGVAKQVLVADPNVVAMLKKNFRRTAGKSSDESSILSCKTSVKTWMIWRVR